MIPISAISVQAMPRRPPGSLPPLGGPSPGPRGDRAAGTPPAAQGLFGSGPQADAAHPSSRSAPAEDKRKAGGSEGDPLAATYIHAHRRGSLEAWVSAVILLEDNEHEDLDLAARLLEHEALRRYQDDFTKEYNLRRVPEDPR